MRPAGLETFAKEHDVRRCNFTHDNSGSAGDGNWCSDLDVALVQDAAAAIQVGVASVRGDVRA
jgi:hypothetical protein